MENNYVWVITNHKGEFILVCATREIALVKMVEWRDSLEYFGFFSDVSKVYNVYFEHIFFDVTYRDGTVCRMNARRVFVSK